MDRVDKMHSDNSKSILISVIIPVYNTEKYVGRCLESVINNTYDNLEVICVNDGSTDNSLDVLKQYQNKDFRIKIIDIPNGGVSNARNIGLDKATGDFIAFIDSDDWIHRQYFSTLLSCQKRYDADVVACNFNKVDAFVEDENLIINEVIMSQFSRSTLQMRKMMMAYIWGKLYRAELLNKVRFDKDVAVCEDLVFSIDILCNKKVNSLGFADANLYYYFNRESSASNTCDQIERAKAGEALIKRAKATASKKTQGVYLDEAFRLLIKARYEILKTSNRGQLTSVNEMINNWLMTEKKLMPLDKRKAMVYKIFAKHPLVYKNYRKIIKIVRK